MHSTVYIGIAASNNFTCPTDEATNQRPACDGALLWLVESASDVTAGCCSSRSVLAVEWLSLSLDATKFCVVGVIRRTLDWQRFAGTGHLRWVDDGVDVTVSSSDSSSSAVDASNIQADWTARFRQFVNNARHGLRQSSVVFSCCQTR